MKEEKFKKLIIGATVTAVILLFVLLVFWMYQIITMSVRKSEIKDLNDKIAYYRAITQDMERDIEERYMASWWLEKYAFELNMKYPDEDYV